MATLRPAVESDVPKLAELDFASNLDHPVTVLPWGKPSDAPPFFLAAYQFYWKHPYYHITVAIIDEEIVGFIVYEEYSETEVEDKFPALPPGTNQAFFDYFTASWKAVVKRFDQKGCYGKLNNGIELEGLATHPDYRRKGIGALLMKHLTDVLDSNKAGCFLRGSVLGKSLYERFGFKTLAEFDSDLSPWGWNKEYWSYYMQRDPVS
jgi:ribosomal protein S18 acetylase RimI-like enzyme